MYKVYFLFALYSSILITTIACRQNGGTATKMTSKSTPANTPIDSNTAIQKELDELEATRGNLNRTIWQQPRTIIRLLGNLKAKTIADIGAGPYGYFSFQLANSAKKVIAIDIDERALSFIDSMRLEVLAPSKQTAIEPRLATPNDPTLKPAEADVIILVNIYAYLTERSDYLQKVKEGLAADGKVLIVDFKMRKLPIGPIQEEKVPLYIVEQELKKAGFQLDLVDDRTLDYQYILIASKG